MQLRYRRTAAFVACTWLAATGGPPAIADGLVEQLGLRAAPAPVREDSGWSPDGPIVVRILAPEQLPPLQAVAGNTPLVGATSEADALAAAGDATAILGFCSAALLEAAPKLHWVQLYSAGADKCVGLPRIRDGSVLLTNLQRVFGQTMAEHVLAMMLSLARGMAPHMAAQAKGDWNPGLVRMTDRVELSGRTLLVVGLGGIGTAVAQKADALGMRVIAVRASGRPGPAFVAEVARPDRLLEMAARADFVVNSVPLTPATEGMYDDAFFSAMRSRAFFINVGRGRSVVTQDLVDALDEGSIAGAGLDVTEPEPLPAEHPLWSMRNVIITPHVSAQSDRTFERVFAVVAENLRRYVEGEPMLSVVDPTAGY